VGGKNQPHHAKLKPSFNTEEGPFEKWEEIRVNSGTSNKKLIAKGKRGKKMRSSKFRPRSQKNNVCWVET